MKHMLHGYLFYAFLQTKKVSTNYFVNRERFPYDETRGC